MTITRDRFASSPNSGVLPCPTSWRGSSSSRSRRCRLIQRSKPPMTSSILTERRRDIYPPHRPRPRELADSRDRTSAPRPGRSHRLAATSTLARPLRLQRVRQHRHPRQPTEDGTQGAHRHDPLSRLSRYGDGGGQHLNRQPTMSASTVPPRAAGRTLWPWRVPPQVAKVLRGPSVTPASYGGRQPPSAFVAGTRVRWPHSASQWHVRPVAERRVIVDG
jgi:hypothetical protein